MLKLGINTASTFGAGRRILVLNYHRIPTIEDSFCPGDPDVQQFEQQLRWLTQYFPIISLAMACELIANDAIDQPYVVLTFDDGYRNNFDNALPVLEKYQVPATFFVVTETLNGGIMWNDSILESFRRSPLTRLKMDFEGSSLLFEMETAVKREEGARKCIDFAKYMSANQRDQFTRSLVDNMRMSGRLPKDLMLNPQQVQLLAARGMSIGAHATRHDILTTLDDEQASKEIFNTKKTLEDMVGKPVDFYAYPNGKFKKDFTVNHVEMVKNAGYRAAVTTDWGASVKSTDLYTLPRLMPWRGSRLGFMTNLLEALYRGGR